MPFAAVPAAKSGLMNAQWPDIKPRCSPRLYVCNFALLFSFVGFGR